MIDITLTPPPSMNSYHNQNTKRKNNEFQDDYKKIKNLTTEDLINSNPEWPQFIHPDGGILKITPWGSIRQYVDLTSGETITKFEDCNFEEYSFKSEQVEKLYQTPTTPQSIYNQSLQQTSHSQQPPHQHQKPQLSQQSSMNSINTSSHNFYNQSQSNIHLSPSHEVESYVVDGYQQQHDQILDNEFQIEHENYFGMN
ncbi:hypothetical protein KGF54_005616 [Candida jiufengensis]|uniref:uncharacterized protein n=1 Tax=Candida jiufengensis TaxID=497108 RepID=UPI002223F3F9|nr:uncharacterized protein KGF54_005616 [Candida jiufengensis]KAI5949381.1 hypothetical protein KGF54_005616 [Candida jiufengensis]